MAAKIFLADDERPVLDGVSAAIKKRLPDVVLCGTASNGNDALRGAMRERPDVILMDVRMPGMSGLETLRRLRAAVPETVPVLLTAYERFDVAKEAFGLGVYDYLVKPVDQDVLIHAIRGALDMASARRAETSLAGNAIAALEVQRPFLEEGFVYAALSGADNIEEYARALGFAPEGGGFVLFSRGLPVPFSSGEADKLRASLAYRLSCAVGAVSGSMLPVFYPASEAASITSAAETAVSESGMNDMRFTVGAVRPFPKLRESWAAAAFIPPLELFAQTLHDGNTEAALSHWLALPDQPLVKALTAGAAAWASGRDAAALNAALVAVQSGSVPMDAFGQSGRDFSSSSRCAEALRYIEEHYADSISLEDVAAWVGFSAAHLSKVLSTETGKPFIEHITSIRMRKAKEALTGGRFTVKEVAASVGYSDPNYFSRAFKKETGSTPSEFAQCRDKGEEV